MPDFYQKITEQQGGLEQLIRRVPGFRGYFERGDRRAADRLLRERLALVFEEQLREFTRLQKRLVDVSGMKYMERVRAIDGRLLTFIDKIRSAPGGYAGWLDSVKINEAALARVYAFDNALFAYQDQLATGLRRLDESVGLAEVDNVLNELEMLVGEMIDAMNHRTEAMRGLQDSA